MCGIAGWIGGPKTAHTEATLASMLQAIAHRGPDGEGMCSFPSGDAGEQVFLGHRRLAIIDPRGGHQPMCDAAAGLALAFNGEIYNFRELRGELAGMGYRFTRDSDTEVLLRAYQHWGENVVDHLRGMFAFVIWDAGERILFMARDRFGEKPLFLHENGDSLYFASEIKALLRVPGVPAAVDHTAVWDYLAYRYVPAPATLFSGIRKLMPGTCATWRDGRLTQRRYWVAPDGGLIATASPRGAAPRDAVASFLGRLDEAVNLQMVSDVPFGAFLSGGLDSSVIVALMRRHNDTVSTFSVGFGEAEYSELKYAAEVAGHLKTSHHELVVKDRDMIDLLPKLIAFRDAPVSEPSDIAIHMLAREASKSVKMVLTGEGSDELLGGYPKHVAEGYARNYQRLPRFVREGLIAPLAQALPYGFRRAKTAVNNLNIEDWHERYISWFGALDFEARKRLAVEHLPAGPTGNRPPFDADQRSSALRRILYFDQTSWLPDNLLERADRMTMAASIESRVPFLDHKLADFVSALPDRFRIRGTHTKWILREAGRKLIPERILNRPKVGFRVPVNEWFRKGMRGFLGDHLQSAASLTRHYYDTKVLDRTVAAHLGGRQNHEKLLWSLLNLEIWHRHYVRA